MYDSFSSDYDRFVNWKGRLAFEMPFIEKQFELLKSATEAPLKVLDAACGTGMHAIELARRGYAAYGADLSTGMIERARVNGKTAGVSVEFKDAGFGALADAWPDLKGCWDAVLCLGNSLPHVLNSQELVDALDDFAACLRPGGLLMIQNRNFDSVLQKQERWMEPQTYAEGEGEWIFQRFYDFLPDGLIQFNLVTLTRQSEALDWKQSVTASQLYPLRQSELVETLTGAEFGRISCFGGLTDTPFEPLTSGNLVITALRA